MAISKRKLKANRANAQKSTGPRTEEGKAAVACNHMKHGLSGNFRVLASEDQSMYDALHKRLLDAEQPADAVEIELVGKMARHTWLSHRAIRCQEGCFQALPQTAEQKEGDRQSLAVYPHVEVFIRYQAHHDRAYQRAAAELAKRKKDRDLRLRGFESQKRAEAEAERREERHEQLTELHPYKLAAAQARLAAQSNRSSAPESALLHPESLSETVPQPTPNRSEPGPAIKTAA